MIFPIFRARENPGDNWQHVPDAPPWRTFFDVPSVREIAPDLSEQDVRKATTFKCEDEKILSSVSAALVLRRPLLVTGGPGTGKSSLAYAIAHDLGLGAVLRWNITSRSSVKDGLYSYDALGRLNETSMQGNAPEIGDFIKLGPLGTSLLPMDRPRVLLVDELDKSDIDLPNDLLNIFEEGTFEIAELVRDKTGKASVIPSDAAVRTERVPIVDGKVFCRAFPIVVLTSNNEREFSPPFLRRCVRINFDDPTREQLETIALSHLETIVEERSGSKGALAGELRKSLTAWEELNKRGFITTDQLMNAMFLLAPAGAASKLNNESKELLRKALLDPVRRKGTSG